ncbi:MAG: hypothetical protein ACRD22_20570, partial [Terriglobia bacterium]
VDRRDLRTHPLNLAIVFGAKNFGKRAFEHDSACTSSLTGTQEKREEASDAAFSAGVRREAEAGGLKNPLRVSHQNQTESRPR